jgi:HSP20 family protein
MSYRDGRVAMATRTAAWWAGALAPIDWSVWLPLPASGIRIEDFLDDSGYVVRAELPGVDPTTDVHLSCHDGILRLRVERNADLREGLRSEFHYGSFERLIELPRGAREESTRATYRNGILEITVEMRDPAYADTEIPILVDEPTQP